MTCEDVPDAAELTAARDHLLRQIAADAAETAAWTGRPAFSAPVMSSKSPFAPVALGVVEPYLPSDPFAVPAWLLPADPEVVE